MTNTQALIETILPKTEHERIAVIGYDEHFKYFVKLLFQRTGTDFRKNFIHAWIPAKLRAYNWSKVIVLNYYPDVSKFYREFEYLEKVEKIPIVDIQDRDL